MLNIGGLQEGVVIDHIKAGGSMEIYHYLELEKLDCSVAIIKNAKSSKMGKKDIIKIEGPITVNLDILGVLDENITINVIKNNEIVEIHPNYKKSHTVNQYICINRNWKHYLGLRKLQHNFLHCYCNFYYRFFVFNRIFY